MRFNWKKASTALVIGLSGAIALSGVAGASTSIPGSGQDNKNDVVIGQGSDTTYVMMNDLSQLYNQSPGCNVDTAKGSSTLGQCLTVGQAANQDNAGDNWDHDDITGLYPTGSGAGIVALINGTDGVHNISYARSSTGPSNGATPSQSGLNFWAYAKDGIAVTTLGNRTGVNITKAQLQGIVAGTITTWGQLLGTAETTPVHFYGMQSSSGTYNTMVNYLGTDPDSTHALKLTATGGFPFENDLKPIIADATTNGYALNSILWWGSFGELKTYSYKAQAANFAKVEGVTLSNSTVSLGTYPITRFLYHVTLKTQADTVEGPAEQDNLGTLTGATTGVNGAVRQFTQFLCEDSGWYTGATDNAALNPFNGHNYYDDITTTVGNSGFQRVPDAARNAGACHVDTATS